MKSNTITLKPIADLRNTNESIYAIEIQEIEIKAGAVVQQIVVTDLEIVVLGIPRDDSDLPEEERHNCDFMGCGTHHVLVRASNY